MDELIDKLIVLEYAKHLSASAQFVQKGFELEHRLLGGDHLHAPFLPLSLFEDLFLHLGSFLALAELPKQHLRTFLLEEWHFIQFHQLFKLGILGVILVCFERAHQDLDFGVIIRVLLEECLRELCEILQCGHFGVEIIVVKLGEGGHGVCAAHVQ